MYISLSPSLDQVPLCRHRLRPVHARNKATSKTEAVRKTERRYIERAPACAVGRLEHCDANVSNRPSQPTICPFVREETPRRCVAPRCTR